MRDQMRKIDAFAHILPPAYLSRLEAHLERTMPPERLRYYREGVFRFEPSITDLGARRPTVEAVGDYAQVLVLAVPPLEEVGPPRVAAEFARLANDEMADLAATNRDLFEGFAAALPMNDVDLAVAELDRAAGSLGALGAQVYTNVNGVPLDDERFEPLWERFEALDRAVWLHPTRSAAFADYPTERESDFGLWWSLGWPYETAAALSRLVYAGVIARHPRLKLIAHHGAGMVPHFAARLGMGPGYRQVRESLPRPPLDYFRRFYADTALFGAAHAVRCVVEFFGVDNVLFGTDMPLGPANSVEHTIADVESLEISDEDRAALFSGNAARLLRLD
jgi:aminocarboxymuconate-semialdehyde decarboxylase